MSGTYDFTTVVTQVSPGVFKGIGLDDIVEQITGFTPENPPWALRGSESPMDNKPFGVPALDVRDYTSSRDMAAVLTALDNALTSPAYGYIPGGTWPLATLGPIGSNAWYGYANSSRKVMGWIGDGAADTILTESPGMIPTAARAYALAPSDTSVGVPLWDFYFSNTQTSVPLFFSGFTLDGVFQGPYGVPASSGLNTNTSTPSPIAHRGLALQRAIPGSRVQFARFRGPAFTIKASPPYELAPLESNYDNGLVIARTEIDGRLPTGEVSSGGYMNNFAINHNMKDVWIHHTRRSGYAIHEHTPTGDNGFYNIDGVQIEHIADTADGFAGSGLGFNGINFEEVTGTVSVKNSRMSMPRSGFYHIALGSSFGNTIAKQIDISDFTSLESVYNGCLVIRIIKNPNSLGINPWWTAYNSGGFSALPIEVTSKGATLTPIASTSFNAAIHGPTKNFVVVTS